MHHVKNSAIAALPVAAPQSHCQAAPQVGWLQVVSSKQDLQAAEAAAKQPGYFIMDATDWKVRAQICV
jgi:hypothetical protein